MNKYLALFALLFAAAAFIACGDSPTPTSSNSVNSTSAIQNPDDTPTKAYGRLFAAVKAKNTDAIKSEFSKSSIAQAEAEASRAKVPPAEVYRNGFTATTFSETLPKLRDQRVNGIMGALEVWNARDNKWEDLPFIREESGWKLAIGDAFAGTWQRPGPGQSMRELQAANSSPGNRSIVNALPAGKDVNVNRMMANLKANSNANGNR